MRVLHLRVRVIDLCRRERIPIEVRPVSVAEICDADQIFAASTAGGVMPVTRLDGRIPGALTSRLRELYWAWHQDPGETTGGRLRLIGIHERCSWPLADCAD